MEETNLAVELRDRLERMDEIFEAPERLTGRYYWFYTESDQDKPLNTSLTAWKEFSFHHCSVSAVARCYLMRPCYFVPFTRCGSSRRADHQCTSQRQFGQWETAWNKHFGQFRVICVFMIITTMGIDNRGQRLSIQSERYRPKHWTVWNTILKRSGGGHNAVYNNWLFTAAQVELEPVESSAPNTKSNLKSF